MPIPPNAPIIGETLDPADVLDFYVALTQGEDNPDNPPILLPGESVAALNVAVTTEAAAVGLKIMSGGASSYPVPKVDNQNVVSFWLAVNDARLGDPAFDGTGVTVGVEITITTNNSPPRKKQRTVAIKVAQR